MIETHVTPAQIASLQEEHQALRRAGEDLFGALENHSPLGALLGGRSPSRLHARLESFRAELQAHFRHEEGWLFAPVKARLQAGSQEHQLLHEFFHSERDHDHMAHRVLSELTLEMLSLLGDRAPGAQARLLVITQQTCRLLAHHMAGEDEHIYPMAEEVLGLHLR